MSLIAVVNLASGATATCCTLAAFVGTELRGVAQAGDPLPFGPYQGARSFLMLIYSASNGNGETVTFKFWDGTEVFDAPESFSYSIDGTQGSVPSPYVITTAVEQRIALSAGWTWFSMNVRGSDSSLGTVLASVAASSGDSIKGPTTFSQYYDGYGWYGTLTALSVTSMYKIKLSSPSTLSYVAPRVALSTELQLTQNWNFLPYLLHEDRSLSLGLPSFAYSNGDFIKSQLQFAEFYEGYGWYGSLTTMEQGKGYMMRLTSAGVTSYATAGARRKLQLPDDVRVAPPTGHIFDLKESKTRAREAVERKLLEQILREQLPSKSDLDVSRYEQSMAITSRVVLDGEVQEKGTLVALVGNEVRGFSGPSATPVPFGPHRGEYAFEIMVYAGAVGAHAAPSPEQVNFMFISGERVISLNIARRSTAADAHAKAALPFVDDDVQGSVLAPVSFVGSLSGSDD